MAFSFIIVQRDQNKRVVLLCLIANLKNIPPKIVQLSKSSGLSQFIKLTRTFCFSNDSNSKIDMTQNSYFSLDNRKTDESKHNEIILGFKDDLHMQEW
jgi:hypothetical protein